MSQQKAQSVKKFSLDWETPIQFLKGVGPQLGAIFERRGIFTVGDLVQYFPRTYEDRRAARTIRSLQANETVSLKAHILKVSSIPLGRGPSKMWDVTLKDSSGMIHCKYFRVPYKGYFERFRPMQEVRVVGRVTDYKGRLEFHHPEIKDVEPEDEDHDQLIPIYTEMEGIPSSRIQKLIDFIFSQWKTSSPSNCETFPDSLMKSENLCSRFQALKDIHAPSIDQAEVFLKNQSQAHRRLIFEEFFWLEMVLAAKKTGLEKEQGISVKAQPQAVQEFLKSLPFELTGAQIRCFQQIQSDLQKDHPMHRLVQGDVGSGKTLVAFLSALQTVKAGYQVCLMAPTEILADQHYRTAEKFLTRAGITTALLVGKTKASEKKRLLQELQQGQIQFLIGTHALIEDDVQFQNLALVIIDEQHRFGVEQRGKLKNKGLSPHFLVMTATPIPRTLAMTVYGDLDVSIIDELPKGRSAIQTRVVYESKRPQVWDYVRAQLKQGRQAYVVYPLVDESEKIDLKNAIQEFENLKTVFPEFRLGLLHGKMKPAEKEDVMEKFRRQELDLLVSTTVIEVGVDVPNANIMVIEHAERFGLSQLHQLRGRVGRGVHKSYCILLMGYAVSEEARQRTQWMEETNDGFKIAEYDLELRGPGEFLGTRQSGLPGFRLAHLVRDVVILQEARQAAFQIFQKDPKLENPENKILRQELLRAHGPAALASIA